MNKELYDFIKKFTYRGLEAGRLQQEELNIKILHRMGLNDSADAIQDAIQDWKIIKENTFKKELLLEKLENKT